MSVDKFLYLILCSSLTMFFGACVSSSDESSEPPVSEEAQQAIAKAKKETEIGRDMTGRLLKFWGAVGKKPLVRYVSEVGAYVAANSEYSDRKFMFEILDTPQVNAFAAPGGYILLTKGAIVNAESEAELAAVIAHEIAHVGKEHMINTLLEKNREFEDDRSDEPESVRVRRRPDPKKSQTGSLLAKYIAGSVAGLNVLKAARQGMSIILEKGLGAELEFEADVEGSKILVNSGYYPFALVEYLCRIETKRGMDKKDCFKERNSKIADQEKTILDKTHPTVPARIQTIMKELDKIDAKSITGAKGQKRFLKRKALLNTASTKK